MSFIYSDLNLYYCLLISDELGQNLTDYLTEELIPKIVL